MVQIDVRARSISLDEPTLVEGFPGVGLVGKIAVDHLVEVFDMRHYADFHCDGLPAAAAYGADGAGLRTAVRLYVDPDRDLVALQSDVPVAPGAAETVADCLSGWLDEHGVTPVFLSGLPADRDGDAAPPALYGVASGDGTDLLAEAGVEPPTEPGLISGPTGAMLLDALATDRTAVGLVVESSPRFPDPEAAHVLLTDGIGPLTGLDVPTDNLVDRAEEIREARERLAERMRSAGEESTQAQPLPMYQ